MPCVKPLDLETVRASAAKTGRLLVVEETAESGCVGQAVVAAMAEDKCPVRTALLNIGDRFVTHGEKKILFEMLGLDARGIARRAKEALFDEE